jgi:hypothetical protein
MTLKEHLNWEGAIANRLESLQQTQREIALGKAKEPAYYFLVGKAKWYAVECYLEGQAQMPKEAAQVVVHATLEYFYGEWRKRLLTPDGTVGHEEWKPHCLWYDEVMGSLPWACALGDWEAVRRIAEYPPANRYPEAAKAGGETAWAWALVAFLRDTSLGQLEQFLTKAETHKAKRPKMLCPVLRALLDNDAVMFKTTLLAYLAYYRRSEFKREVEKLLSLDGTTLYHLGRKQGLRVQLPEDLNNHVIQFEQNPSMNGLIG